MSVRVILGTMTFGGQADKEAAVEIVRLFLKSLGGDRALHAELDSAHMYPAKEKVGVTNALLGEILREHAKEFGRLQISSKANPWVEGKLSPASVRMQCKTSFESIGKQMSLFYLHAPDATTPIEDTLAEIDALHREGMFVEFGLSNYASWQVAEIYYLCKAKGYVLPTVYQGVYNLFCRTVEPELLPCLRRLNIRFYAYNATAGGLLTGKYAHVEQKPTEGRFQNPMYLDRYWKRENFEAVSCMKEACEKCSIAPADAAHRWLARHSKLDGARGDGIIIGASTTAHVAQNTLACAAAEPLPADVLGAIEAANALIKDQFRYYR